MRARLETGLSRLCASGEKCKVVFARRVLSQSHGRAARRIRPNCPFRLFPPAGCTIVLAG
ncbi:hypothetical protein SAMN04488094_101530 [Tropicimonas isoalkanivorans]|uniref:Uncharacterized protein n=1 Tax=Tropicimonas isoalkanivorans TaxID=441112 RepID=A0A1I1DX40_9RHOB|nr:hypothetical protein SAMN04488094_101530 [Tropicimonas isoalkanivorans]